jgi:hypothetical protein
MTTAGQFRHLVEIPFNTNHPSDDVYIWLVDNIGEPGDVWTCNIAVLYDDKEPKRLTYYFKDEGAAMAFKLAWIQYA